LENGVEVASESGKADTFNQFLSSVYTWETTDQISPSQKSPVKTLLLDIVVLEQEVLQLLKKTKRDKSPGLDGLHPRVLKCAVELAKPLATLFRKTLQEGKIPDDWWEASIYKKG